MESYLAGRQQAVIGEKLPGGKSKSEWVEMNRGVPQGTIFGPLFFLCFTSDIGKILKTAKHAMYADDLGVYIPDLPSDLGTAVDTLSIEASAIETWAVKNNLLLNAGKTQAIIIGSNKFINAIYAKNIPKVKVEGTEIEFSEEVKYLGIIIDSKLSWSAQVKSTVSKAHGALHRLKRPKNV